MLASRDQLQELRRTEGVGLHVAGYLVHGLSDTDLRSQVVDDVNAIECFDPHVPVTDIASYSFYRGWNPGRPIGGQSVNLCDEGVQNPHSVALGQKRFHKMRTNKTGATRYQDMIHIISI